MTSTASSRSVSLLGLDGGGLRRAVSLAFAAWLSFAIASLLHVGNAYWAAMPVWVLTQPSRGLVFERALYRLVGTLIGAAVGLAMVALPLPAAAQAALLSMWVAAMATMTHLLRGVSGYGALLSGMTAAIVVIPDLFAPDTASSVALARVECTLIGVLVSTLVLGWLTPGSELGAFYADARAVAADALRFAGRVLAAGGVASDLAVEERGIVERISLLDASARMISAGSRTGYKRLADVELLIVGAMNAMAAAQALQVERQGGNDALATTLLHAGDALAAGATETLAPGPPESSGSAPLQRLHEAVAQVRAAVRSLSGAGVPGQGELRARMRLAPHREWSLGWRAGGLAGGACLAASLAGLALPFASMHLVALGVCVFGLLLSSLPLPQQIAPKLVAGVSAGVAVAVIYRLGVQPHIGGSAALLLTLAPFLLAGGVARAHPKTSIAGLDANMCFLLASQAGVPGAAPAAAIFSDALALVLPALVLGGLFILRPRRAERQAANAVATIRRDLIRILERDDARPTEWEASGMRQILRLTLHLSRAGSVARFWPSGLLAVLNLGHTLIALSRHGLPAAQRERLRAALRMGADPGEFARVVREAAEAEDSGAASAAESTALMKQLAVHVEHGRELLAFAGGHFGAFPRR